MSANDDDERPSPDALLARVTAEERPSGRGTLKVFFGFAPGVGKTYRMLKVAHELEQQGRRVMIGVVEDHRRRETMALTVGLERLPPRRLTHRGRTLEELDLDGALAARPDVLLVDELAHSNAPGSRHDKRWQDVEELVRAGVDVLTTMNVQHLESLNDVVHQILRVRVRETVPDAVVDRADAIELVDVAPEELLHRLDEGKVYLGDQARRASEHFFERGNLLALRELALRRTAQHVDDDVVAWREAHGVSTTWPTAERVLVCVGPAPSSQRLIRATARIAAGLRCPWTAASVGATTAAPLDEAGLARLDQHLALAESLGAEVARLHGASVAEAVLSHARKTNTTRIVIGKPTHARLRDRLRGSLLDDVVRGSGDIDVHVLSGEADEAASNAREVPARERSTLAHHGAAVAVIGATTLFALGVRTLVDVPDAEMLYLLAIMASSLRWGRGPSITAAVLAVASYDFFFVPPTFTFTVDDRRYVLTFAMMFVVGLLLSELAGRVRRQERDARRREEQTSALLALSRGLAVTTETPDIAKLAGESATRAFGLAARVVVAAGNDLDTADAGGAEASRVAIWVFDHGESAGRGTSTLAGAPVLAVPLHAGSSRLGVLLLDLPEGRALTRDERGFLDGYARQTALALERARLADEARSAALRAKTEELRASLLATVSHDLRTPLASITGAATTLRGSGVELGPQVREELLGSIVEQADRLERLVANLLDMTRVEGMVAPSCDWVPLDELIGAALTRLEGRLGDRPVSVDVSPDLPLAFVDPILFEQVLVNLLENAERYTPAGSPIDIVAASGPRAITLTVSDRGPGIPEHALATIFEKFVRVAPASTPGAGLGLAICRGIVHAHGGTIRASNRADGGAIFEVTLPRAEPPRSTGAPS